MHHQTEDVQGTEEGTDKVEDVKNRVETDEPLKANKERSTTEDIYDQFVWIDPMHHETEEVQVTEEGTDKFEDVTKAIETFEPIKANTEHPTTEDILDQFVWIDPMHHETEEGQVIEKGTEMFEDVTEGEEPENDLNTSVSIDELYTLAEAEVSEITISNNATVMKETEIERLVSNEEKHSIENAVTESSRKFTKEIEQTHETKNSITMKAELSKFKNTDDLVDEGENLMAMIREEERGEITPKKSHLEELNNMLDLLQKEKSKGKYYIKYEKLLNEIEEQLAKIEEQQIPEEYESATLKETSLLTAYEDITSEEEVTDDIEEEGEVTTNLEQEKSGVKKLVTAKPATLKTPQSREQNEEITISSSKTFEQSREPVFTLRMKESSKVLESTEHQIAEKIKKSDTNYKIESESSLVPRITLNEQEENEVENKSILISSASLFEESTKQGVTVPTEELEEEVNTSNENQIAEAEKTNESTNVEKSSASSSQMTSELFPTQEVLTSPTIFLEKLEETVIPLELTTETFQILETSEELISQIVEDKEGTIATEDFASTLQVEDITTQVFEEALASIEEFKETELYKLTSVVQLVVTSEKTFPIAETKENKKSIVTKKLTTEKQIVEESAETGTHQLTSELPPLTEEIFETSEESVSQTFENKKDKQATVEVFANTLEITHKTSQPLEGTTISTEETSRELKKTGAYELTSEKQIVLTETTPNIFAESEEIPEVVETEESTNNEKILPSTIVMEDKLDHTELLVNKIEETPIYRSSLQSKIVVTEVGTETMDASEEFIKETDENKDLKDDSVAAAEETSEESQETEWHSLTSQKQMVVTEALPKILETSEETHENNEYKHGIGVSKETSEEGKETALDKLTSQKQMVITEAVPTILETSEEIDKSKENSTNAKDFHHTMQIFSSSKGISQESETTETLKLTSELPIILTEKRTKISETSVELVTQSIADEDTIETLEGTLSSTEETIKDFEETELNNMTSQIQMTITETELNVLKTTVKTAQIADSEENKESTNTEQILPRTSLINHKLDLTTEAKFTTSKQILGESAEIGTYNLTSELPILTEKIAQSTDESFGQTIEDKESKEATIAIEAIENTLEITHKPIHVLERTTIYAEKTSNELKDIKAHELTSEKQIVLTETTSTILETSEEILEVVETNEGTNNKKTSGTILMEHKSDHTIVGLLTSSKEISDEVEETSIYKSTPESQIIVTELQTETLQENEEFVHPTIDNKKLKEVTVFSTDELEEKHKLNSEIQIVTRESESNSEGTTQAIETKRGKESTFIENGFHSTIQMDHISIQSIEEELTIANKIAGQSENIGKYKLTSEVPILTDKTSQILETSEKLISQTVDDKQSKEDTNAENVFTSSLEFAHKTTQTLEGTTISGEQNLDEFEETELHKMTSEIHIEVTKTVLNMSEEMSELAETEEDEKSKNIENAFPSTVEHKSASTLEEILVPSKKTLEISEKTVSYKLTSELPATEETTEILESSEEVMSQTAQEEEGTKAKERFPITLEIEHKTAETLKDVLSSTEVTLEDFEESELYKLTSEKHIAVTETVRNFSEKVAETQESKEFTNIENGFSTSKEIENKLTLEGIVTASKIITEKLEKTKTYQVTSELPTIITEKTSQVLKTSKKIVSQTVESKESIKAEKGFASTLQIEDETIARTLISTEELEETESSKLSSVIHMEVTETVPHILETSEAIEVKETENNVETFLSTMPVEHKSATTLEEILVISNKPSEITEDTRTNKLTSEPEIVTEESLEILESPDKEKNTNIEKKITTTLLIEHKTDESFQETTAEKFEETESESEMVLTDVSKITNKEYMQETKGAEDTKENINTKEVLANTVEIVHTQDLRFSSTEPLVSAILFTKTSPIITIPFLETTINTIIQTEIEGLDMKTTTSTSEFATIKMNEKEENKELETIVTEQETLVETSRESHEIIFTLLMSEPSKEMEPTEDIANHLVIEEDDKQTVKQEESTKLSETVGTRESSTKPLFETGPTYVNNFSELPLGTEEIQKKSEEFGVVQDEEETISTTERSTVFDFDKELKKNINESLQKAVDALETDSDYLTTGISLTTGLMIEKNTSERTQSKTEQFSEVPSIISLTDTTAMGEKTKLYVTQELAKSVITEKTESTETKETKKDKELFVTWQSGDILKSTSMHSPEKTSRRHLVTPDSESTESLMKISEKEDMEEKSKDSFTQDDRTETDELEKALEVLETIADVFISDQATMKIFATPLMDINTVQNIEDKEENDAILFSEQPVAISEIRIGTESEELLNVSEVLSKIQEDLQNVTSRTEIETILPEATQKTVAGFKENEVGTEPVEQEMTKTVEIKTTQLQTEISREITTINETGISNTDKAKIETPTGAMEKVSSEKIKNSNSREEIVKTYGSTEKIKNTEFSREPTTEFEQRKTQGTGEERSYEYIKTTGASVLEEKVNNEMHKTKITEEEKSSDYLKTSERSTTLVLEEELNEEIETALEGKESFEDFATNLNEMFSTLLEKNKITLSEETSTVILTMKQLETTKQPAETTGEKAKTTFALEESSLSSIESKVSESEVTLCELCADEIATQRERVVKTEIVSDLNTKPTVKNPETQKTEPTLCELCDKTATEANERITEQTAMHEIQNINVTQLSQYTSANILEMTASAQIYLNKTTKAPESLVTSTNTNADYIENTFIQGSTTEQLTSTTKPEFEISIGVSKTLKTSQKSIEESNFRDASDLDKITKISESSREQENLPTEKLNFKASSEKNSETGAETSDLDEEKKGETKKGTEHGTEVYGGESTQNLEPEEELSLSEIPIEGTEIGEKEVQPTKENLLEENLETIQYTEKETEVSRLQSTQNLEAEEKLSLSVKLTEPTEIGETVFLSTEESIETIKYTAKKTKVSSPVETERLKPEDKSHLEKSTEEQLRDNEKQDIEPSTESPMPIDETISEKNLGEPKYTERKETSATTIELPIEISTKQILNKTIFSKEEYKVESTASVIGTATNKNLSETEQATSEVIFQLSKSEDDTENKNDQRDSKTVSFARDGSTLEITSQGSLKTEVLTHKETSVGTLSAKKVLTETSLEVDTPHIHTVEAGNGELTEASIRFSESIQTETCLEEISQTREGETGPQTQKTGNSGTEALSTGPITGKTLERELTGEEREDFRHSEDAIATAQIVEGTTSGITDRAGEEITSDGRRPTENENITKTTYKIELVSSLQPKDQSTAPQLQRLTEPPAVTEAHSLKIEELHSTTNEMRLSSIEDIIIVHNDSTPVKKTASFETITEASTSSTTSTISRPGTITTATLFLLLSTLFGNVTETTATSLSEVLASESEPFVQILPDNATDTLILYFHGQNKSVPKALNGSKWVRFQDGHDQNHEKLKEIVKLSNIKFPKFVDLDKCNQSDFDSIGKCFCEIDSVVNLLKEGVNAKKLVQGVSCANFLKVKDKISINNKSEPFKREKRSYMFERYQRQIKREIVDYSKGFFQEDFKLENTNGMLYVLLGSSFKLGCFKKKESLETNRFMRYVWSYDGLQIAENQVDEETGDLVLRNISGKDSGNYTCSVKYRLNEQSSVVQQYDHHLLAVTPSIFKIRTNLIYGMEEDCHLHDADIIATFLPRLLEGLLCGYSEKICNVKVRAPQCGKKNLNVTFTITLLPLNQILPGIDEVICNLTCMVRTYSSLATVIVKNIANFEQLSVISNMGNNKELKPILHYVQQSEGRTGVPVLMISCPSGFGIERREPRLCVVCPKDTSNDGVESYCKKCPSGQYQPAPGSKSCIVCSSPLENSACLRVLYTNTEYFKLYVGVAFGLVALIMLLILYCTRNAEKNEENEVDYKYEKLNRGHDMEKGLNHRRKPPKVPPRDF